MERIVATVSESGQLILDDETKNALGVPSGGEIDLYRGTQSVELRKKRQAMSDEEIERSINELQTLLARRPGEPSLEDELYKMRREEEDIIAMAGSLAGGDDMVAELQRERRQHRW